jgi:hypothetical protein
LLAATNDEERRQIWDTLSVDEQCRLWELEAKSIDPGERKRRKELLEALPGWNELPTE